MKNNLLTRKEEIILTTISLIHEYGGNQVSMKEIGKREGVSEAALYKHFKNKEALLLGVIAYYAQYDDFIFSSIRLGENGTREELLLYFNIYAEYYENYKEVTSLISFCDSLLYDEGLAAEVKQMMKKRILFLTGLIERTQKNGELTDQIQPEDFTYILYGTFENIIRMWRLQEYSFSLKDRIQQVIGSIVREFTEKRR